MPTIDDTLAAGDAALEAAQTNDHKFAKQAKTISRLIISLSNQANNSQEPDDSGLVTLRSSLITKLDEIKALLEA